MQNKQIEVINIDALVSQALAEGNDFINARQCVDKNIPNANYNAAYKVFWEVANDSQNPSAPLATIYLGALLCAGKGTEFNREQGAKCIEKGMTLCKEKLDPNFSFRLGKLHYNGRVYGDTNSENRIKELKQAVIFFKEAFAGGITEATEYIVNALNALKEALEKDMKNALRLANYYYDRAEMYGSYGRINPYGEYVNHKDKEQDEAFRMNSKFIDISQNIDKELDYVKKELQAIKDSTYDW